MIKKIRESLTVKICILMAVLLLVSSGITYAAIAGFLPTYYSSQLQKDLDVLSGEMVDSIQTYKTIDEAANTIELFEAGAQVSVTILDEKGEWVWPVTETAVEEAVFYSEDTEEVTYNGAAEEVQVSSEETAAAEAGAEDVIQEFDVQAEIVDSFREYVDTAMEDVSGAQESYENNSAVKSYSFKMDGKEYTMFVSGGMQPVNQAMEILQKLFPYIFGIAVLTAVFFAAASSFYLTRPIVKLSRISKRMASLDFDNFYQGKRKDEIGALGADLNELSKNLSNALDELKKANESLKSDIEKEREIEKKRIAFFSAVSHELKTPITILKGHLSGILQGVGGYQDREYYLRRSQDTVEKMKNMVTELLTVSRIENQTFHVQRTDIAELLRQKVADLTELIENKSLGLEVTIPEHLYADVNPDMLEKVFSNLLMNAIRYTPEGKENEVRVVLRSVQEDERIECLVENTGVHISEEDLPHVFEAFYRAEQSRNSQTGGSGLGLYIVKMILEQHGAQYFISNMEDGVRFFFSLSK